MHTTPTPSTSRPLSGRRRLALLVAPALALVIAVGCGDDDPATGETAVMGATVERPSEGTIPGRRIVAESTDRAAPVGPSDAVRIGGVRVVAESSDRVRPADSPRIVAESTDRVRPADSGDVRTAVVASRYSGQAAAYAAGNVDATRPVRVNGGRTED